MDPSYSELIDLLDSAEIALETDSARRSVSVILTEKFTARYPQIRFLDTVKRLAAPTKPSCFGKKLFGSPLASYRRRCCIPRIRQKQGKFMSILYRYVQVQYTYHSLQIPMFFRQAYDSVMFQRAHSKEHFSNV